MTPARLRDRVARRAYNVLHPRLTLLFPDDPALVESFFLDLRGGRPVVEDAEEDEL